MLDATLQAAHSARPAAAPRSQAVFRMITSDRMAGSIPAWVSADSAKDKTLAALAQTHDAAASDFAGDLSAATMAYAPQQAGAQEKSNDEPFGFGDLVDIINPLQHIPVVSTLYRTITGDTIRPSSEIVGGAIYGGVAGAASSLANVIIKEETGKNFGEHALAMVTGGHESKVMAGGSSPSRAGAPAGNAAAPVAIASNVDHDKPLERLAAAQSAPATPLSQLPGNMLSFVDLGSAREPGNRPVKPLPAQPVRYAEIYRFNA